MNDRIIYTCEIEDGLGLITYVLVASLFSCLFFMSIALLIYSMVTGEVF